jgi:polysaccharide export outer membrane protein
MMNRVLAVAGQCLLGLALVASATLAQSGAQQFPRVQNQDVVVGPDDSVTIVAMNCEEVSKTWRVGTKGELNLPMVGVIQAAGMTVQQLTAQVTERLQKYLRDPQVTIFIAEQRSQPVMVTGAVDKPGTYQMGTEKVLFEVLLMAGGPKAAGPSVSIRRNASVGHLDIPGVKEYQDDGYNFVNLDLTEVMSGRGDKATLRLRPHDIVSVAPTQPSRYVHITGEVLRPGAVELVTQDSVSLLRVVATAGGTSSLASLGKTMIMHVSADGAQASQPVFIDLKKIMQGKAMDISLTAGDVVVISRSGVKAMLQTATNAAMNTGVSSTVLILGRL